MLVDNHGKIENWDENRKLCPHFTLKELANNKGDKTIPQFILNVRVEKFLSMLEEMRVWYNKPITLSSAYRQPKYNARAGVNGEVGSAHTYACAVDWPVAHTEAQRKNVADKWKAIGDKYGIVCSINNYTHGYHLEAYSDVWYGQKSFTIREYRGKKGDW